MESNFMDLKIKGFEKKQKRRKIWLRIVFVLSVVTVFCTTYALVLPAITMIKDDAVVCGYENHKHIDSCFEKREIVTYKCTDSGHKHSDRCFDTEGNCICGFADYAIHSHDRACFDSDGRLGCTLPEIGEHIHDEGCTETNTTFTCGKEEAEGHIHADECYLVESALICGEEETEEHSHTDECYSETRILACNKQEAEEHHHTEACTETTTVDVCPLKQAVFHAHGDECYDTDGNLICKTVETKEAAFHEHTDECFANGMTVCKKAQILKHQHSDCVNRKTESVLVCELPEHEHNEKCLPRSIDSEETEYFCGYYYEHTHSEDCHKNGVRYCNLNEHTHTVDCRFNAEASIETEKIWEESFSKAKLTGNWATDAVAIANTQIGYEESRENFNKAQTDEIKGYTRYGAWYGDPYGDWSAMFCSFCLSYAGVDSGVVEKEKDCQKWVEALTVTKLFHKQGKYVPKQGDLVFFGDEKAENKKATRVGFVCEVIASTEDKPLRIRTIEGDYHNQVFDKNVYDLNNSSILGYGEIPQSQKEAEAAFVTLTATTQNGITVTVTAAPESLMFPVEELTLEAEYVEDELADEMMNAEQEKNGIESRKNILFEIKLIHNGEEVEPVGPLTLSFSGLGVDGVTDYGVYHIDKNKKTVETMKPSIGEEGNVSIETDHFSLYGISLLAAAPANLSELPLQNGGTLTLDRDYVANTTINITSNTTLDLNGHDIYVNCDPLFNVTGGTLTIRNSGGSDETATVVSGEITTGNGAGVSKSNYVPLRNYVLTNSSNFNPWGDGAFANLFDNNAGTKMGGGVSGGQLTIEFEANSPEAIYEYSLTSGGDTGVYTSRAPRSWVLYGQKNGSWVQLDSVSSMVADSGVEHKYSVDSPDTYSKYRIVFQTNGDFQMADIKLYPQPTEGLDYYITETVVSDSFSGATTETLVKHTVTSGGMIVGDGSGRAITVSGGTVNLQGGYISGFDVSSNNRTSESNIANSAGGAICANGGGTINLTGAVIAGNAARDGGGIYVGSGSTLNISGNAVVASNESTGNNSQMYGGGGVYIYGGTCNMSGGYVTNNLCSNPATPCRGGGGFMVRSGVLNLTGGYITGNNSPGGGAIMTYRENSYEAGGKIYMSGGFVSGNTAYSKEGGGVSIDGYGYMKITGGYITNNVAGGGIVNADHFYDWGGGGIFLSDYQALLYIENALVTENRAGGFGGGIAGCSTGRLNIAVRDVCASFNNTALGQHLSGAGNQKNEDHFYAAENPVFMSMGYQDYYCALSSIVSGGMLGGGTAGWTGSVDGEPVSSTSRNDMLVAASVMGLTANPSEGDKQIASDHAMVFINGNESPTHGGGILANGYLVIGPQSIQSYCRLEFSATKNLIATNNSSVNLGNRVFNFVIEDEYGVEVSRGQNDSTGAIKFDDRIAFTEPGTYTYYAYETTPEGTSGNGVSPDTTRFRVVVEVINTVSTITVNNENFNKELLSFSRITVINDRTNEVIRTYTPDSSDPASRIANDEMHAVVLDPTGNRAFRNINSAATRVTVQKRWADSGTHNGITVRLYRNGTAMTGNTYRRTLSSSNNWTYTWSNLSTGSGGTNYTYTVVEDAVGGYVASYDTTYSLSSGVVTELVTITNTPVSDLTFTLNIKKVSKVEADKVLPNATFELHNSNNAPLHFTYDSESKRYTYVPDNTSGSVTEMISASNGYIRVDNLPAGSYTLHETAAPSGYETVQPITISLNSNTPNQTLDITVEDPELIIRPELPATGGIGTTLIYGLGIMMTVAAACASALRYFKRRKVQEQT